MSIIDKKQKPLATGTLEQEIAEINLLLSEVGIRLRALGLRLVCSIEEEQTQRDNNAPLLKQSMKLYTEEQVKRMMQLARETYASEGQILLSFTPIELPSDEEIDRELESHEHTTLELEAGFRAGAKYVINKIQGGNK